MTQEIADRPADTKLRAMRGGQYIYYRQPNGWITMGSGQKMDASNYQEGGWVPLPKYKTFVLDHVSINHPLDHLFRNGGAKELPLDQLIEEGWAYRDYYVDGVKVEYPQLAGVTLPPLEVCHHCGRTGTHAQIRNHEEVQHQKDMAPQKMAEALGKAMKGQTTDLVVETPQPASLPYVCGRCNEGFRGHMPLARHVKEQHNDS